jgi:glycosyltransferase involved in cell wall biosynthesis
MLSSDHVYPSQTGVSWGPHPKEYPSGSGHLLHDLLAKGLAEAGHEVLYCLPRGATAPLPPGVRLISEPDASAQIYHNAAFRDEDTIAFAESRGMPWVTTCHVDRSTRQERGWNVGSNWIFVSKSLARSHGSTRYVHNGIDPAGCMFSESKANYLLFLTALERAWDKGLDTAFTVSRRVGIRLVVAGTASGYGIIHRIAKACKENRADFVVDVRGSRKSELLAGARALLFPTKLNEGFGLVLAEALMSGTPVICSGKGACPEVVSPEVGFVCGELDEYVAAVDRLHEIQPSVCRSFALERYHYQRMTAGYLKEYEAEIAASRMGASA